MKTLCIFDLCNGTAPKDMLVWFVCISVVFQDLVPMIYMNGS